MKDGTKALLLGLLAVSIWSTVATAFKITLRSMDPLTMVYLSSLVSLIAIGSYVLIRRQQGQLLHMNRKEKVLSVTAGLLNPFIYYLVLFESYDRLPAQLAQSINYSWPVILTVLSILFLGQKISGRSIAGILVGFVGVVIVSTKGFSVFGGMPDGTGILLALSSAIIWALFWTINLRTRSPTAPKLFLNFLGGMFPLSLLILISGPELPPVEGLAPVAYVGVFEMGLTFIIWLSALTMARDTARISSLIYLSPFISLVLINVVLEEAILPSTIVGLFFIVFGIVVQRTGGKG